MIELTDRYYISCAYGQKAAIWLLFVVAICGE
jgi:hypothetical protein